MKKYILILTAVVLAVMSCSTDNIENGPSSLDIEIVPAWDITRGITSASQTVKLTVNLNVQTIHWQVSSDSKWCKVDSDLIHTGSDEVELVVESNDSFDKRNAVLTVTAGRYTKKVEIGDIYKDLGLGSKIEKKDVSVYVDGVVDPENKIVPIAITKDNDDDSYGANGVLTEVFYDDDADTVTITEVNTYVGEISKTVKATSKKDAYVVVIPEGVKPTSMKNSEEFETTASFDDDAYVLYTYSEDAK